jgi:autotransporter-associated beta strand protein
VDNDFAKYVTDVDPLTSGNQPSVTALVAADYATGAETTWTGTGTVNAKPTTSQGLTANRNVNSLNLSGGTALTISDSGGSRTLTLESGGLLSSGADHQITVSTLTSGTSGSASELFATVQSSSLTVSSVIANNGAGAVTLVKSGAGTLILTGANTYTGPTYINGGTLSISANNNLGAVGTGAQINMNGGTLQATASFALDNSGSFKRNVVLGASGGTIDVTSANELTLSGVVSGAGNLSKTGTGTLTFTGANTYTGGTTLSGGTLQLGANGVIPDTGTFAFSGGTLGANDKNETFGALSLTSSSTIRLGTGTGREDLIFASASHTSGTLTIDNWVGTINGGAGANEDRIIFNSNADTGGFLASVFWLDQGITGAQFISIGGGQFELVPVPEPGTILAGCLLVGIFGWTERKRLGRLFA